MDDASLLGFTEQDIHSARAYVEYRHLLKTRNECLLKAPHIFTHTTLVIEAANTVDDYIIEAELENFAIKVKWSFDETGCNTSSCFPTFPLSQICKHDSTPFSFGLPNGSAMNACQPACFNSKLDAADNYVTREQSQSVPPQLNWIDNACWMENYALTAFFVDPSKQQDTDTQSGMKDIKADVTGFDVYVTKLGADGSPVTCARINPKYCKSFYMDFVKDTDEKALPEDNACGYDGAIYYVQLVFGSSLIKLTRLSVEKFEKAVRTFTKLALRKVDATEKPLFLQHFPATREFLSSVKRWKNNINTAKKSLPENITLNELGLSDQRLRDRLVWTDAYCHIDDGRNDKYGGRLMEKNQTLPSHINGTHRNDEDERRNTEEFLKNFLSAESTRIKDTVTKKNQLSDNDVVDSVQKIIFECGSMLSKDQINETLIEAGADASQVICKKLLKHFTPEMIAGLLKSEAIAGIKIVSGKLLSLALSHALINVMVESIALQVGRVAVALAGVVSSALSIIGWLMLIGPIMDIVFTFIWDPLHFTRPTLSDTLLRKISESTLLQRQITYGSRQIEMTPYMFWNLHVANRASPATETLCILQHTLFYFSCRKMSSDGSVIEWVITDNNEYDSNSDRISTAFRHAVIRNLILTDMNTYENGMRRRAQMVKYIASGTVVGTLCTVYITYAYRNAITGILIIFLIILNAVICIGYASIFTATHATWIPVLF